ncbi:MAG: SulP family inorganic anion transporter [Nitrospirota bacterium]|nr:SulP family inorganic anion transporter [Nitrospirota bacterium]MDH5585617.1 SulP family inorganic anion transporter [Nitrospirota bacterium]MDH5773559.1 SulP family inorganic anion transporter [Nitrospirota bacterium]
MISRDLTNIPIGTISDFPKNWKADILSGFLVFLIALPLCLGISLACGYPAISGIFTAIIGGMLATFFSNSELTIKGPAAGLIVIAIGCVTEFGFTGGEDPALDFQAYRLALGVGVVAGIIQIFLGLVRAGILGEFFPHSAVHGLLTAIGIIIMAKQFPIALGVRPDGKPLELIAKIPQFVMEMNPLVGLIGILSLLIMFSYLFIKNPKIKVIPAPMVVLLVTVPLAMYLNIGQDQTYSFNGQDYSLGKRFLVAVPNNMFHAITFPDFSGLLTMTGWKYVVMFSLIGSIESLLSAKAIDAIDPWRRKTNHDRDMLAVGVGNTVAAFVGGLPMISEIVRSKANIDNGARTRFANMFHGMLLLLFVALVPGMINQIPLAALGAMLVFTGYRLASPQEFIHMYHVGKEQFIIFVSTVIGVLATDLLMGIAIGICVNIVLHLKNGAPLPSLFKPQIQVDREKGRAVIVKVKDSAIFSTWIALKKTLESLASEPHVVLDLSDTFLVDHTTMSKLHEMEKEFQERQSRLEIVGLDHHQPLSKHPEAGRKKPRK